MAPMAGDTERHIRNTAGAILYHMGVLDAELDERLRLLNTDSVTVVANVRSL